jgi:hypothetical protein
LTAEGDYDCCWFGDFTPCLTITGPDAPGRTAHVIYEQPLGDACVPR